MSQIPSRVKAAPSRNDHLMKWAMMLLLGLMLVSSLSACGKRGDPYRPSEVPTDSTS